MRKMKAGFAVFALLAAALLAACTNDQAATGNSEGNGTSSPAGESSSGNDSGGETLVLGGLYTLTGAGAVLGVPEKQGVQMAIDDVNAKGGLDVNGSKVKVELKDYDVGEDPVKAVEFTQRLVNNDGVKFIYGARENTQLAGELKITDPAKVIVYSAVASTPLLTVGSEYGFNVTDNGAIEKHALIELLAEKEETLEAAGLDVERIKQVKRVALLGRNELYVLQGVEGAKEAVEKHGLEWAGEVIFPPGTTDFLPFVAKLKELKPDAVILDTYSYELMIPPLKEMLRTDGLDWTNGEILLLGNDVLATDHFVQTAKQEGISLNGAIAFSAQPPAANSAVIEFHERVIEKYGPDSLISTITAAYEATMTLFHAIEQAGTITDTDKVVETMKQIEYPGMNFPIKFDDKKQLVQPEFMLTIEDDKIRDTGIIYLESLYYGWAYQQISQ